MELGQIVFRWGDSFSYRLFGVGSIHLRGGESFLFLFFWGLSRLVYPLYALWLFASILMHFYLYLSKKKTKRHSWWLFDEQHGLDGVMVSTWSEFFPNTGLGSAIELEILALPYSIWCRLLIGPWKLWSERNLAIALSWMIQGREQRTIG